LINSAGARDPVRIQFDPDLAIEAAPDVNLRNTRYTSKAITDLNFNQFRKFHGIEVAGNSQQHDRKTGDVEFADAGPDDIIRQLVDLVFEFALNINRRCINFRPPHETDTNRASAL
jgi:hypothetical protein